MRTQHVENVRDHQEDAAAAGNVDPGTGVGAPDEAQADGAEGGADAEEAQPAPATDCVIIGVPAADVPKVWPRVRAFTETFNVDQHRNIPQPSLYTMLLDKKRQMWIAAKGQDIKAVALTELVERQVVLDFCAGIDRQEWRDKMVDEIMRWGRWLGCDQMKIICRPGWAREIRGFKETHRILERSI